MKRLLAFGTIALTLAACSPNQKGETSPTSTKPSIQEVFNSSETLNGTALKYPAGKPELRLYRVEIPAGGKIPMHTHTAPMMVYVQGVRSGSLLNTRLQPDGTELKPFSSRARHLLKAQMSLITLKMSATNQQLFG